VVPSQHGAKGALKALRHNQTVALMGDRPTGGPVIAVRFFGRRTCLPQGPWRIALVSGAALLPAFMHRRCNGGFTLEIGAPLHTPAAGTLAERMAAQAQAWADSFAARLRADPGQWAAFRSVWLAEGATENDVAQCAPLRQNEVAERLTWVAGGDGTNKEAGK
jgi:KDO2-lipid IV(A) lauroyltransferase